MLCTKSISNFLVVTNIRKLFSRTYLLGFTVALSESILQFLSANVIFIIHTALRKRRGLNVTRYERNINTCRTKRTTSFLVDIVNSGHRFKADNSYLSNGINFHNQNNKSSRFIS
jgi:hypothetical protein